MSTAAEPAIDVARIERELTQLLQQPAGPDGAEVVTRACMANLIIVCTTQDQHDRIAAEVAPIVRRHPSRVLVLFGDARQTGYNLGVQVAAACHEVGEGRRFCSEHVTLTATGDAVRRLPSTVRPLLIGDLPTALWWAHNEPPPLGGDLFRELAVMADHVIYESMSWPDPVGGVVATASWATSPQTSQVIDDLAWRRLKPWRRLIGQAMDPSVTKGALEAITDVTIEHGPHVLQQTWMLLGWLANRLGWQPEGGKVIPNEAITWKFRSPRGPVRIAAKRQTDRTATIHRLALTWKNGPQPQTGEFTWVGEGRLGFGIQGSEMPPLVLAAPYESRATMIAKQLADRSRDDLFLNTLQLSRQMAEALQ